MKAAVVWVLVGLGVAAALHGQGLQGWTGPMLPRPVYRLSVTPLDWKFASRTGVSTHRIEEQVTQRILEGLGWARRRENGNARAQKVPEASVRVDLSIVREPRQRISYSFRVVVDTPKDWPLWSWRAVNGPEAWHWEKGGSGNSGDGDYPRELRLNLDKVLQELALEWDARLKKLSAAGTGDQ